jgi:cellulose synthase/poly-beta-1,6-N-acetylglucosamine synthase-like glycosyltransferase
MIELLTAFLWLIVMLPALLMLVFTLEVWLGIGRTKSIEYTGRVPETCILIPAHDESRGIVQTLERLRPAISETIRVVVVADNCTDETAALVREQGFEVVERFNEKDRGKGFALAFGRDYLRAAPPQCVIVIDADCYSDARSVADLARCACDARSAVQARNVLEPRQTGSAKVQVSSFAFWIKNVVRQRGTYRAGGGAILTGTGMAFPWELFDRIPLATGSIVEDLSLSVDLIRSGEAPCYLEQATIYSAPASEQATIGQRSRWEQGFLTVSLSHALPLIWRGLVTLDQKAILLGSHLIVPPMTLLMAICGLISAILGGVAIFTGNWLPFAVLAAALVAALSGVLFNWALEGHLWLTPRALTTLPLYLLWKLPMYGRYFAGKRVGWVRTKRD